MLATAGLYTGEPAGGVSSRPIMPFLVDIFPLVPFDLTSAKLGAKTKKKNGDVAEKKPERKK